MRGRWQFALLSPVIPLKAGIRMPPSPPFSPVIPAKAGIQMPPSPPPSPLFQRKRESRGDAAGGDYAALSESGFTGLAGFSGFRFVHLALFAIAVNPAKTNRDERTPLERRAGRILKIL